MPLPERRPRAERPEAGSFARGPAASRQLQCGAMTLGAQSRIAVFGAKPKSLCIWANCLHQRSTHVMHPPPMHGGPPAVVPGPVWLEHFVELDAVFFRDRHIGRRSRIHRPAASVDIEHSVPYYPARLMRVPAKR